MQKNIRTALPESQGGGVVGIGWVNGILAAWKEVKGAQGLTSGKLRISGLTDPTRQPNEQHYTGAHGIGIGIDLGVAAYIDQRNQLRPLYTPIPDGFAQPGHYIVNSWSIANAKNGAAELVNAAGNEQRDALLNFLSLYALTRNTGDPGTWSVLPVKNGEPVRAALFGSGWANDEQLIQNVWIGGDGTVDVKEKVTVLGVTVEIAKTKYQNPFKGINDVLGQLGFHGPQNDPVLHHGPTVDHHHHFHIDLRAPQRVDLPQNLLAGDSATAVANDALIANAQAWLDQVKADLNLTEGKVTMFIPDMPNVPPQDAPVMIAQANQSQSGAAAKVRTLGVCSPKPNKYYSADNGLIPITSAGKYLLGYENRTPPATATTAIVQPPKHGVLRLVTEADRGILFGKTADPLDPNANLYAYLPDPDYVGKDSATIEVDFGDGLKVNVKYFFQAVSGGLGDDWVGDYCSKTGPFWKISSTLDASGNSTITAIDYLPPDPSTTGTTFNDALTSWLNLAQLDGKLAELSGVNITFADLTGAAVGQTIGSTITLDTNAAGHNWYIDTTPWDNSEYLPTSNSNEWVAKEGTDAYGKMDMLSVLLHENEVSVQANARSALRRN